MTTTQTIVQPIAYIHFNGNANETIEFYGKALQAKLVSKATYGEIPTGDSEQNRISEADKDKIVNAQLELPGGGQFYVMDTPSFIPYTDISGITLTLNYPTVEEGEKAFRALCEGGTITMDWCDTFWAEKFGMVDDKFGVSWLVNGNLR
ncbi:MAG TPA: VOC family protein [Fimbriimonadaceae bacterium]|jgi:PhnB protein